MKLFVWLALLQSAFSVKLRGLQDQTLLELVDGTTLGTAVELAGLVEALSGRGPFTVLAPSDEAFEGVPSKYLAQNYKFHLQNVLLYHVIDEEVVSEDLMDGMVVPTLLEGESVNVTVKMDGNVTFSPSLTGEATVTMPDIEATNGVAHVIDDVLTPAFISSSIADIAVSAGFSTLVDAAVAAGLADALGMEGNYTVLAPTNEAFAAVPNLEDILADTDMLTSILSYHVIPDVVHSSTLMASGSAPTLGGKDVMYTVEDGTVTFMGETSATVTTPDILANNGIIHVIDAVLLPPLSLLELVEGSTLSTAIQVAGLTEALAGDGPFTVLAPTDEAFEPVPSKYLAPNYKFHLQAILLYHVLNGTVTSDMLMDGMMVPTLLEGEILNVTIMNDTVGFMPSLTGIANVTTPDIEATNGVAHVIDDVLTPAFISSSIADIAVSAGFSTLVDAAVAAGLADALGMEGNYTVLAPTNEAFAAVPNLEDILADTDMLTSILSYHVIPDVVHSSTLMANGSAPTLEGSEIMYTVDDGMVIFMGENSANVTAADILANNGIIHAIDAVLLPPVPTAAPATMAPTMSPDETSGASSRTLGCILLAVCATSAFSWL